MSNYCALDWVKWKQRINHFDIHLCRCFGLYLVQLHWSFRNYFCRLHYCTRKLDKTQSCCIGSKDLPGFHLCNYQRFALYTPRLYKKLICWKVCAFVTWSKVIYYTWNSHGRNSLCFLFPKNRPTTEKPRWGEFMPDLNPRFKFVFCQFGYTVLLHKPLYL